MFSVVNARNRPVADAVVTAYPPGLKSGAIRFSWPREMDQHNLQFDPFVLIVPVGADISFPNRDPVRHHVYSFSPGPSVRVEALRQGREPQRALRAGRGGGPGLQHPR
ncbi:MAG: hypothetical protein WDN45_10055 [Caulobacteraceae bacterium]